jgi:GDPmannose 4,6-dehydratase
LSKSVLITGISGQDGAYLSQLLLNNGYKVIGLVRSHSDSDLKGLHYLGIADKIKIEECDLADFSQVIKIIEQYKPDEIYNLAAQSSVSLSFKQPIGTFTFNTISVFNLLEAIKMINSTIKFYQASSSEMFGSINHLPITEDAEFHPKSPYAISKAAAHWTCVNYKESYGMFVCCGILFNHESYLRNKNFFMKKILQEAIEIKNGKREVLEVGNLEIRRDFGYAPKFVEAMYLMMQKDKPNNYLICSGSSVSLREIVNMVFDKLDIDKCKIKISEELYRPAEIENIYGNPEKAKKELGWQYDMSIENIIDILLKEESNNYHILKTG